MEGWSSALCCTRASGRCHRWWWPDEQGSSRRFHAHSLSVCLSPPNFRARSAGWVRRPFSGITAGLRRSLVAVRHARPASSASRLSTVREGAAGQNSKQVTTPSLEHAARRCDQRNTCPPGTRLRLSEAAPTSLARRIAISPVPPRSHDT